MRKYFVCNTTSYNNTDYGRPITIHKSTDYRTSTGTHHRFIAPFPNQDFDARVKIPHKSIKNPVFKTDFYVSDQSRNYRAKKSTKSHLDVAKPNFCLKVNCLKSFEETLFKDPPRPIDGFKTETEESYGFKYIPFEHRTVYPPNPYHVCEMRSFGRDEQPPLRIDQNGYFKLLDIYLSTQRADYAPFGQEKLYGIARKNIITYYDGSGVPRGGKGYGPKDDFIIEPLVPRRIKPEINKGNKKVLRDYNKTEAVPHYAYKSEYNDEYQTQTRSYMEPYIYAIGSDFDDPLPKPTAWQNLSAPAMYCTEGCHIGTGWPIRSVIEYKKPKKEYVHKTRENCYCPKSY